MKKEWRPAAVEAASAASHASRRNKDLRRARPRALHPAAREMPVRAISLERRATAPSVETYANGRFHDKRSRRQVAVFVVHRLLASDERNRRAHARWNESVRQQWELEHLGSSRPIT